MSMLTSCRVPVLVHWKSKRVPLKIKHTHENYIKVIHMQIIAQVLICTKGTADLHKWVLKYSTIKKIEKDII